jgi:hypothetical protein
MRGGMVLLGLGLGVLWIVGLSYGATSWLVWLDFAAAIASLATVLAPDSAPWVLRGGPFAIAAALFVLWAVGLAGGATPWLAWWTFGFAMAFLLLGAWATAGIRAGAATQTRTTLGGPRSA